LSKIFATHCAPPASTTLVVNRNLETDSLFHILFRHYMVAITITLKD
jgi:hypothetical protein